MAKKTLADKLFADHQARGDDKVNPTLDDLTAQITDALGQAAEVGDADFGKVMLDFGRNVLKLGQQTRRGVKNKAPEANDMIALQRESQAKDRVIEALTKQRDTAVARLAESAPAETVEPVA